VSIEFATFFVSGLNVNGHCEIRRRLGPEGFLAQPGSGAIAEARALASSPCGVPDARLAASDLGEAAERHLDRRSPPRAAPPRRSSKARKSSAWGFSVCKLNGRHNSGRTSSRPINSSSNSRPLR
jgi:hypothetical protein